MMINKKGINGWIWILIILTILVIGGIIYFIVSGGSDSGSLLGGNSIPHPPSLPE